MDDLKDLDEQLYRNLLSLKSYDGEIADLCMTFSVADNGTPLVSVLGDAAARSAVAEGRLCDV